MKHLMGPVGLLTPQAGKKRVLTMSRDLCHIAQVDRFEISSVVDMSSHYEVV